MIFNTTVNTIENNIGTKASRDWAETMELILVKVQKETKGDKGDKAELEMMENQLKIWLSYGNTGTELNLSCFKWADGC
jgi:hypothetical protein